MKPAILIIHGSWHQPAHYQRLVDHFQSAGYDSICPLLPSFDAPRADIGVKEDSATIRRAIEDLLAQGRELIVLGHSYGGVIMSEAITSGYDIRARSLAGMKGGVIGLLFICAFVLLPGQSLCTALGGALPPFIPQDSRGMCTMMVPENFYNDLPSDEVKHWASLLRPSPAVTQLTPITNASYLTYPSVYLHCDEDRKLPVALQKWMVKAASLLGAKFTSLAINASHSPFLSVPGEIVKIVDEGLTNDLWNTQDLSGEHQELQIEFGSIMASLGPPPA